MNTQILLIIGGVMLASIVLAIPFYLMSKKKANQEDALSVEHINDAILHIYGGSSISIDDQPLTTFKHLVGQHMQKVIVLKPGIHKIGGKFEATTVAMGKNKNLKTPKEIYSEINFEGGYEYSLGLYFYSPEERYNYYQGDIGEVAFSGMLDVSNSGLSGITKVYLICYKEKYHGEQIKVG